VNAVEYAGLDALALAELVRAREVTPRELVAAAVDRIDEIDADVNAVAHRMFDDAAGAAEAGSTGPLAGVPMLLKDSSAACQGTRLTEGSAFLGDYVSTRDSELVRRFKQAGLIVLGKTTTPEFAIMGTTESLRYGPTRNPWRPDRIVGGSSGGAGAAVAAGYVPLAHGGDIGGSIRIPASCCGVFGLKPSRGRMPLDPEVGGEINSAWVTEHVITRSVRDSAALLDATAGARAGARDALGGPDEGFLAATRKPPPRLRIAFSWLAPGGLPIDAECRVAVERAASLLCELGHDVEPADPPAAGDEDLLDAVGTTQGAGLAVAIRAWGRRLEREPAPELLEPLTWASFEHGRSVSGADYLEALDRLQRASRDVAAFFATFDVVLTPTLRAPPLPIGYLAPTAAEPEELSRRDWENCPFTALWNVTGQPAMSVPLHWSDDGLPVGVQLVARPGEERTLLGLAAQLEEARPWAARRPPVAERRAAPA
jgi:amidase